MRNRRIIIPLSGLIITLLVASCGDREYTPKPVGYIRIDLPEKHYTNYEDPQLPFTFDKAEDAEVVWKKNDRRLKWIDLYYPKYNATIYLSHVLMRGKGDLRGQVDTAYRLRKLHYIYSSGIDEQAFYNGPDQVYGTTCRIKGQNVASTYQFWVTDSAHHFLRGALYVDCVPNNDSLAPILDYLQKDVDHLIETVKWRE